MPHLMARRRDGLRAAVCALLLGAFATGAWAQQASDLDRIVTIDVPPQYVSTALIELSRETGVQVIMPGTTLDRVKSGGVKGQMSLRQALSMLLRGTALIFRQTAPSTITVTAPAKGLSPRPRESQGENSRSGGAIGPARAPRGESAQASFPSKEPVQLQEVIVTAQKRAERLIDTPQSVSVVSAADISKLGATKFSDFANTVPGLSFQTLGAGYTQVTLRGVTAGVDISPTVGIYVDDVPYGSSAAFALAAQLALDVGLFDLDRIEVLRGPQGTLYGASTMGGLIKYVTKRPSTTGFGGDVQAGISDTRDGGVNYDVAGAVNLPVADTTALRVSGFESHDGGYMDNVALGRSDVNHSDIYGGRVDLLAKPSDRLDVRVGAFVQDIFRNGQATTDYTFAGAPTFGSLGQHRLLEEPFTQHFALVSGTVNYDFGGATLTSISSYQEPITHQLQDFSAFYVPLLTAFGLPYGAVGAMYEATTRKFTQEVRLASNGTRTLEWLIGGFYTHENSDTAVNFVLRDTAGQPAPNMLFSFDELSRYEEYAAFGDLTWRITSRFDITGGLRYARNKQSYTQSGAGLLASSIPTSGSEQGVTTYLGDARYHLSQHATAYVRYATGYRPGGPNPQLLNPLTGAPVGPATFQPDRLKSYEAGFKAETADRRFGFDVAGYYIDWKNIQVAIIESGFGARGNVPSGAGIRGAELSLNARPIEPLVLTGTFAYQSTYLREADPDLGALRGEPLPNVPKTTATLNGDYLFGGVRFRPTFGATVRYVDARWASWTNSLSNPQYHLPVYTSVDLRGGVTLGNVSLQVYAHNLFNERAQLSAYTQLGTAQVAIMQPRTIGIAANASF